jgi:hypothetical protein
MHTENSQLDESVGEADLTNISLCFFIRTPVWIVS